MWNDNLQLQNDIGLREGTAYTSLTVLINASQTHNCRRMRREYRSQSSALARMPDVFSMALTEIVL